MDVWSLGGKSVRQTLVKLLHVLADALLIAFDWQQKVTGFFLDDNSRRLGLGVEGIGGDQRAFDLYPAE